MKRKIAILSILALVAIPTITFAASQGYQSYLHMPAREQVEGSSRKYDYANHKVSIDVDSVYDPAYDKKVVISLNTSGWFSSKQQKRTTVSYSVGATKTVEMGNHGTGKKWYGFGGFENALKDGYDGKGATFAGIRSENVVMTSYK